MASKTLEQIRYSTVIECNRYVSMVRQLIILGYPSNKAIGAVIKTYGLNSKEAEYLIETLLEQSN